MIGDIFTIVLLNPMINFLVILNNVLFSSFGLAIIAFTIAFTIAIAKPSAAVVAVTVAEPGALLSVPAQRRVHHVRRPGPDDCHGDRMPRQRRG